MSGREQHMLTVARTPTGDPLLVLLDEPSERVAPLIVERIDRHYRRIEEDGTVDRRLGTKHRLRAAGVRPGLPARKGGGCGGTT